MLHTLFCQCNAFLWTAAISLCFDFTASQGDISCGLHLVLRQSRVPCIHHSRSSCCGFSCHFGSVLYEWCLPSGATHAGEYILPGHWKENLTSAMLILAVMSSSICGNKKRRLRCHFKVEQMTFTSLLFSVFFFSSNTVSCDRSVHYPESYAETTESSLP